MARCPSCGSQLSITVSTCVCGWSPALPDATEPFWASLLGQWLVHGRFRIERHIERGGEAAVFAAFDAHANRHVALKIYPPSFASNSDPFEALRRLREILVQVRHEHCVSIYDLHEDDALGMVFLSMELIDGETLASKITRGPLPEIEVRRIGTAIAAALAHLHGFGTEGLVHQDVKPSNILIQEADRGVKLTDFGTASALWRRAPGSVRRARATLRYLAPEVLAGAPPSRASDMYALGATLAEALIGSLPWLDATPAVQRRLPTRIVDASVEVSQMLLRLVTTDPTTRPDAAEIRDVLGTPVRIRTGVHVVGGPLWDWVHVPGSTFLMGTPDEERRLSDERQFRAVVSRGYDIARTVVTQRAWKSVMDSEPWTELDSRHVLASPDAPAIGVSWWMAQEFIRKLNEREPGARYRLPTEIEWELAARARSSTPYFFGASADELRQHAWYNANTVQAGRPYAQVVAQLRENAFGMADTLGNVWEWCGCGYAPYPKGQATDWVGPVDAGQRVLRGGAYNSSATDCRVAIRSRSVPTYSCSSIGFRVAREV